MVLVRQGREAGGCHTTARGRCWYSAGPEALGASWHSLSLDESRTKVVVYFPTFPLTRNTGVAVPKSKAFDPGVRTICVPFVVI